MPDLNDFEAEDASTERRTMYRILCLGPFGVRCARELEARGVSPQHILCLIRENAGNSLAGLRAIEIPSASYKNVTSREILFESLPELAHPTEFEFVIGALWEGFSLQWFLNVLPKRREFSNVSLGIGILPSSIHGNLRRTQAMNVVARGRMEDKLITCVDLGVLTNGLGPGASLSALEGHCAENIAEALVAVIRAIELSEDGADSLRWFWTDIGNWITEMVFVSTRVSNNESLAQLINNLQSNPVLRNVKENIVAAFALITFSGDPPVAKITELINGLGHFCKQETLAVQLVQDPKEEGNITLSLFIYRACIGVMGATSVAPNTKPMIPLPSEIDGLPLCPTAAEGVPSPQPSLGKPKQEELFLDVLALSRFAKTEPTQYKSENLDIPTYLRRRIKL